MSGAFWKRNSRFHWSPEASLSSLGRASLGTLRAEIPTTFRSEISRGQTFPACVSEPG